MPLYKHDCDNCQYLGVWHGPDRYEGTNEIVGVDLYVCVAKDTRPGHITLVAREDSEGHRYRSGLCFGVSSLNRGEAETCSLAQALIRALDRGIITEADVSKSEGREFRL